MTATPFDFTAFENVVQAWVAGATEIDAVWGSQNAPQPAYPFCVLNKLSGPVPYSWDWENVHDYIPQGQWEDEDTEAIADVVEQAHRVPCAIVVSIRALVASDSAVSATEYLTRAQAGLSQSVYENAFHVADIGIIDRGSVRSLQEFFPDAVMSFAMLEIKFAVRMTTSEYLSYIERVHAISTDLGVDRILGVDGDDK